MLSDYKYMTLGKRQTMQTTKRSVVVKENAWNKITHIVRAHLGKSICRGNVSRNISTMLTSTLSG